MYTILLNYNLYQFYCRILHRMWAIWKALLGDTVCDSHFHFELCRWYPLWLLFIGLAKYWLLGFCFLFTSDFFFFILRLMLSSFRSLQICRISFVREFYDIRIMCLPSCVPTCICSFTSGSIKKELTTKLNQ